MKAMKFWKTIIALASFAFAGTQAKAETLKIQYTKEDRSSHILLVEEDVEFLDFEGSGLTSLTLPDGLASLEALKLSGNRLTRLVLPEGLSSLKTLDLSFNPLTNLTLPAGLSSLKELNLIGNRLTNLVLPEGLSSLERLILGPEDWGEVVTLDLLSGCLSWNSMPGIKYQIQVQRFESGPWDGIKEVIAVSEQTRFCLLQGPYQAVRVVEFQETTHLQVPWRMNNYDWEIIFGGRWKPFEEIPPSAPFRIEYYRTQPLSMRRLEDGIEIVWEDSLLQTSTTIDGPWEDVAFGGGTLRWNIRPSNSEPSKFFRLKP